MSHPGPRPDRSRPVGRRSEPDRYSADPYAPGPYSPRPAGRPAPVDPYAPRPAGGREQGLYGSDLYGGRDGGVGGGSGAAPGPRYGEHPAPGRDRYDPAGYDRPGYPPGHDRSGHGAAGADPAGYPGPRYADPGGDRPVRPARRRRRPLRLVRLVALLLVALVVLGGLWVDSTLNRVDALADYPGRIADTPGTNWLIVGSDSRAGLTDEQESELATGDEAAAGGQRTDTMLLLHHGEGGTALVSLPRDSAVPIPGYGEDKLNAAFAFGGAPLLVQTVETVTGVRIDHYAEIGFGGFAGLVDDVGGVTLCPPAPIVDPLAGLDIPAGCQQMDGAQALGYVRTRYSPLGDIDRAVRQREFLGALIDRATSAGVLANPFRSLPFATGLAGSFTVDDGDHLWHLARLAWAMRGLAGGDAVTTTVPYASLNDGGNVRWDRERALLLFDAIAQDRPVPPEAVIG